MLLGVIDLFVLGVISDKEDFFSVSILEMDTSCAKLLAILFLERFLGGFSAFLSRTC